MIIEGQGTYGTFNWARTETNRRGREETNERRCRAGGLGKEGEKWDSLGKDQKAKVFQGKNAYDETAKSTREKAKERRGKEKLHTNPVKWDRKINVLNKIAL